MTDEQKQQAAILRATRYLFPPNGTTSEALSAGADAIQRLAKVEEALREVLKEAASLTDSIIDGQRGCYVFWGYDAACGYQHETDWQPTAIDALLAAHESAKEAK